MSLYYKPNRKPDWNYGGPKWRLSRSKIALFMECARCFYVDNKLGVARPPGFPFNLNSAVDALLKKEFDIHRANSTKHPIHEQYGVDAVPFAHEEMNTWRENFKGIEVKHKPTGFTIAGAVDDIWVNKTGELIVVDYKSTSKDAKIESLDEAWHDGYKRQMEIYQWLLRERGFAVSDTGYWVYANASKDREAFDGKLEFEVTLVPHIGSTDWVEGTLKALKACGDSDTIPAAAPDCDYCRYRDAAGEVLKRFASRSEGRTWASAPERSSGRSKAPKKDEEKTTTELF
ncbi:MAG: PD-(D/E)XK nuclease family protein [Patescibacteria group bacterium]